MAIAVVVAALAFAAPASATTFCLPNTSFAACPAGSTAPASLEAALTTNASDGTPDSIVIDTGLTIDTTGGAASTGTDPLEIAGAGRGPGVDATRVSTTANLTNSVVLNVQSRPTTIHDLTIVDPATFPSGFGTGLRTGSATVQNVDVQSLNVGGSDGVILGGGSTFIDGAFYGDTGIEGAGTLDGAVTTDAPTGGVTVSRVTINDAALGVSLFNGNASLTLRRSLIVNPTSEGVLVNDTGIGNIQNTVIQTNGTAVALSAQQLNDGHTAILTVKNVTAVRSGATDAQPALNSSVNVGVTGSAQMVVDDSIISGYANSHARTGSASGTANLTIRHSDLFYSGMFPSGFSTGTGSLFFAPSNIYADPLFAGATDFHLLAGSLAIDQADPAATIVEDFDGSARPTDGDGDGVARNDMGAFEYQPPVVVTPPPTGTTPGTTTTTTKKKCKKKKQRSASSAKKCKKKRR